MALKSLVHGADIHAMNDAGFTAVRIAQQAGYFGLVKQLEIEVWRLSPERDCAHPALGMSHLTESLSESEQALLFLDGQHERLSKEFLEASEQLSHLLKDGRLSGEALNTLASYDKECGELDAHIGDLSDKIGKSQQSAQSLRFGILTGLTTESELLTQARLVKVLLGEERQLHEVLNQGHTVISYFNDLRHHLVKPAPRELLTESQILCTLDIQCLRSLLALPGTKRAAQNCLNSPIAEARPFILERIVRVGTMLYF
jgi:hypothetical protein